jgi:Fungal specific transcription factor domain
MLQASHRHEAIRYGVLALSSYCESLSNPYEVQANAAQARRHYSKTLSAAASSAALQHSASTDEVLLLGLLLHCVELFRQQYADAYVHLQAALNIVNDMSPSEISRSRIANIVVRLRKRPKLSIDSVSLARAASELPSSVDDARHRLMQIHGWICIRLHNSHYGHEDSLCQGFQLQLLEFRTDLDEFCRTSRFKTGVEARNAIYIRVMHGLVALAVSMISAVDDGSENFSRMSNEIHVRELLEYCKAFADAGLDETSGDRPIHFGFDTEFILIVVFLACSTSEHTLRRDAMSLLRSAHRQEGSWDSFHAAHIIECFDRIDFRERAVISTVEYFYDRSACGPTPQSRDFARPDTVCVQIGDQDSSTQSTKWFRCTCNCLKLCGSNTPSTSPINMTLDTAHCTNMLIPAYEQTEFTPSIVTQIFISARYRQGCMPTHLGSSAIAVRQKTSAAF